MTAAPQSPAVATPPLATAGPTSEAGGGPPVLSPASDTYVQQPLAAQLDDTAAPAEEGEANAGAAMPRVIGLDLSLTATGIASSLGWVATVTSQPPRTPRDPKTGKPLPPTVQQRRERLATLTVEILDFVSGADLVLVEAPAFDSKTGHQHDRSGLWWRVVEAVIAYGIPLVEVTTGGLKKYATGKGNAGKDAVLAAVVRRYSTVEVSNNNEADAVALAAMGARWLGSPIDDAPQICRDALAKVVWPEQAIA